MSKKEVLVRSAGTMVYRVRNNKKEFLIVQGRRGKVWEFPKGNIEKGESPKDAAIRETREEAGLSVKILEGFKHDIHYNPANHIKKTVTFYIATTKNTRVKILRKEIRAYAWMSYNKARRKITFDNAKKALDHAVQHLKNLC